MGVKQLDKDFRITLNLDTKGYKDKPTKDENETRKLYNRVHKKNNVVSIKPEDLIAAVEEGKTFTPGIMEGNGEKGWRAQQIIGADIDNKKDRLDENGEKVTMPCDHIITPKEALEIMKANNLDPLFMYHTFSSTKDLPKFRVVCALSEEITEGEEAKRLTRKLANLFNSATNEPNADTSITNLDRMLLGSTPGSVCYKSDHVTDKADLEKLIDPEQPKEDDFSKLLKVYTEDDRQLEADRDNFDLLDYVLKDNPGSKPKKIGSNLYVNPCPICGHDKDFHIKNKSFWACYGGSTSDKTNGSIIDYLMYKDGLDLHGALDKFYYEIMGHPRKGRVVEVKAESGEIVPTNTKVVSEYTEFDHRILKKPLYIGENFISDDGRIYGVDNRGLVFTIIPTEVYPLERLCNIESNKERITITFKRNGKWVDKTIDKIIIASHSKVVELANYGLPITSIRAKSFVSYMAAAENLNDIPVVRTIDYFGWLNTSDNKAHFIPYDKQVKFDGAEEYKDLTRSLKPHGDKEAWFNLVKDIRKNTATQFIPQLFMSISLASALLKPLNMQPFIANLWGLTGRGKTATLKLATSIWGNPEDGKLITDGDTTPTALFSKASVLKSLPLCIDDFSKIDLKRLTIESLIYTLCSGTDRARANVEGGLKAVKTWRNSIITTFERPLVDGSMKGGAINRVLDFEAQSEDIFENPGMIFETIQANYGFLGEIFINKILEIGEAKLSEIRKSYENQIIETAAATGEKKEMKQIIPLSIVLTADHIAAEIFGDGITLNTKKLIRFLKGTNDVSDGQRAYNHLVDFLAINARNFIDLDNPALDNIETYKSSFQTYGYTGTEDNNYYVFLNGLQLDTILNGSGFNKKVFLNWLRDHELIKLSSNGFSSAKRIPGSPKPIRVYAIRIKDQEGDNEFTEADPKTTPWT